MSSPPRSGPHILVVDDNEGMVQLLRDNLGDAGYDVSAAHSGAEAVEVLRTRAVDVVLTDLRMEQIDGFDVLDAARAVDEDIPVIIMTAFGAIDSAVEAIKRGAYHYVAKPFSLDEVRLYVERALGQRRLRAEHRAMRCALRDRGSLGGLVGRSEPMQRLYGLIERVAASAAPVLILGESGTGKELVARAIHEEGARRDQPFVAINCTALPEPLLESELFGHVRGAFTGATGARRGLFVEASGGTIFLDEIGDMQPGLQARLLRVLQEGEVRAVGSDVARSVDVRVIAATHRDLDQRVREGTFRADLFYRLNVVPVVVPPLRERAQDIPLLVAHFLERARGKNPSSRVRRLGPAAIAALARAPWPGNVRELENLVERLVIVGDAPELGIDELRRAAPALFPETSPLASAQQRLIPLRELETEYIAWVVAQCGGNKTRAAEILGIDVSTIHRKRDRLG